MMSRHERTAAIENAQYDILSVLEEYPSSVWGAALGAVIAVIKISKKDAAEISEEESAKWRMYE